jgi:hypothetical protein
VTHVTRDQIIHVIRARVTAISRFPVTCVTTGIARGLTDLTSGYNAVTGEAVRRAAQAFRKLLRERDDRSTCQPAARVTRLVTVTSVTLPNNPLCFPWGSDRDALRGNSFRCQRFASILRAVSLCCGHIGRALWAQRSDRERLGCAPAPGHALARPIFPQERNGILKSMGWGEIWRSFPNFICSRNFAAPSENSGGSQRKTLPSNEGHACR